jgi:hypothetical protein
LRALAVKKQRRNPLSDAPLSVSAETIPVPVAAVKNISSAAASRQAQMHNNQYPSRFLEKREGI